MVGSSRFVRHRKEVPEELVPLNVRIKVNVDPVSLCVHVRESDWREFYVTKYSVFVGY